MQRVFSFVLLGLGVFAVGLGILLRTWAYPTLAKIPVDIDKTSVAQGSNITALLIGEGPGGFPEPRIETGLNLTSVTHVTGDLTAPEVRDGGDVAAWVEASRVTDDASGIVVNASVREVCIDRHTAMAVAPCENQYLEDEAKGSKIKAPRAEIQQPGLSFKFPFGTEQITYQMYDTAVHRPVDTRFDGEEEIKGLSVYRFVQDIPPTKVGEREVPGTLIDHSERVVKVDLYYEAKRTLWVEPVTGAIISGRQEGKRELRTSDEGPGAGTYVFDGALQLNDRTVDGNIADAEKNLSKLWLLTTLPVILWIGGAALVLAALAMFKFGGGQGKRRDLGNPPRRQPVGAGV